MQFFIIILTHVHVDRESALEQCFLVQVIHDIHNSYRFNRCTCSCSNMPDVTYTDIMYVYITPVLDLT